MASATNRLSSPCLGKCAARSTLTILLPRVIHKQFRFDHGPRNETRSFQEPLPDPLLADTAGPCSTWAFCNEGWEFSKILRIQEKREIQWRRRLNPSKDLGPMRRWTRQRRRSTASSHVGHANDGQTDQRQTESEYASRAAQATEGIHILLCQLTGRLGLQLGDWLCDDLWAALVRTRLVRAVVYVVVEIVAVPIVIASIALTVVVRVELIRVVRPLTVVQAIDDLVIVVIRVAGVAQARTVSVNLSCIPDIRAVVLTVGYFVAVIIQLAEIAALGAYRGDRIRTIINAVAHAVFVRVQLAAIASCVVDFLPQ